MSDNKVIDFPMDFETRILLTTPLMIRNEKALMCDELAEFFLASSPSFATKKELDHYAKVMNKLQKYMEWQNQTMRTYQEVLGEPDGE
jgi:hypothetical protein